MNFPWKENQVKRVVGESIKLKVYLGSQIVESETIRITDKKGFFTKRFYLNATESGMKRVKVAITPLEGEQRRENNYASEYVEVLDSKRNITLIAHAPHPDLNAISLALESNLHQEVSIIYASDIKSNTDFSETDVAILDKYTQLSRTYSASYYYSYK